MGRQEKSLKHPIGQFLLKECLTVHDTVGCHVKFCLKKWYLIERLKFKVTIPALFYFIKFHHTKPKCEQDNLKSQSDDHSTSFPYSYTDKESCGIIDTEFPNGSHSFVCENGKIITPKPISNSSLSPNSQNVKTDIVTTKSGKNAEFSWNMVKHCIKNVIFFYTFLEEKDQNIQLNDTFPLRKQNSPGMRYQIIPHFVHAWWQLTCRRWWAGKTSYASVALQQV